MNTVTVGVLGVHKKVLEMGWGCGGSLCKKKPGTAPMPDTASSRWLCVLVSGGIEFIFLPVAVFWI